MAVTSCWQNKKPGLCLSSTSDKPSLSACSSVLLTIHTASVLWSDVKKGKYLLCHKKNHSSALVILVFTDNSGHWDSPHPAPQGSILPLMEYKKRHVEENLVNEVQIKSLGPDQEAKLNVVFLCVYSLKWQILQWLTWNQLFRVSGIRACCNRSPCTDSTGAYLSWSPIRSPSEIKYNSMTNLVSSNSRI